MTTDQAGKVFMDTYAYGIVNVLRGWLEGIGGPGMRAEAFGSVTWADLGVVAFFVVLTMFLNALLAAILRRQTRRAAE